MAQVEKAVLSLQKQQIDIAKALSALKAEPVRFREKFKRTKAKLSDEDWLAQRQQLAAKARESRWKSKKKKRRPKKRPPA